MSFVYQYKLYKNFRELNTDEFVFNDKRWYLVIKRFRKKEDIYYISIYLRCVNPPSLATYSISLQKYYGNVKDIIKKEKVNNHLFLDNGYGFNEFIEEDKIFNRNNDFIIVSINVENLYDFSYEDISKCNYFNDSILNDIKITVENKDIYESKYILSINSPYFMSMFKSNMIESSYNKNDSINIKDFKYEQIINVFYYIHTKKIIYYDENYIDKILEMYEVAHYFQIEDLISKIEILLINKIDIMNFSTIIIFSDKYNIVNLKNATIYYILINKKEIINNENFKKIIDNGKTELIYDLFKKLTLDEEHL